MTSGTSRNFSACTELFPGKIPSDVRSVNADWKPTARCANHYAVLYSALSKSPLVVVERLSRAHISDAGEAPMGYAAFAKRTGWSLPGAAGGQRHAAGEF